MSPFRRQSWMRFRWGLTTTWRRPRQHSSCASWLQCRLDLQSSLSTAPVPYFGEFEQLVLLAILRLGADAYGVTIAGELEERAGRRVSRVARRVVHHARTARN